jgi:hypothetical protein
MPDGSAGFLKREELSKEFVNYGLSKQFQWRQGVDPIDALLAIRNSMNKDVGPEMLAKGFVQPTSAISGLAQYDLEQGAKLLYPITTPFRNIIPRLTGGLGIQANWRSVTAVNPNRISAGLSEGHRGGAIGQTVTDNLAAFKTLGYDDFVTEQAYMAGLTFEDLLSLAHHTTLQALMEGEELIDIGGNNSLALGTASTPSGSPHTTGGSLADASTYSVIVVALTFDGMTRSTVAGGVALPYTRANLDGSTDQIQGFSGIQSAASASVNVSGGSGAGSITATVTATKGAFGYAWYLGLTAGTEKLVAITGYPAVTMTALNASGQAATALPATDTSTNSLVYNGMLTQILTSGSGAYYVDQGGVALTATGSGTGRITEFDTAIASFIANYRLVPTDIVMNPTDLKAVGALILTSNTNLAPFFVNPATGEIKGGTVVMEYTNASGFGNPTLKMWAHPFVPPGTIIFYTRTSQYPLSNVPQWIRKLCRRDYWAVDWPVVTMQRTNGVYMDGVLQMYFPPAFGVITGVRASGT